MKYELEQRLCTFGEGVIDLCKSLPKDQINNPMINQFIRSGTSIGANYYEANSASSKKDFKNKIHICKKEAQETEYWLRLLLKNNKEHSAAINGLREENSQYILIFGKVISTINQSQKLNIDSKLKTQN